MHGVLVRVHMSLFGRNKFFSGAQNSLSILLKSTVCVYFKINGYTPRNFRLRRSLGSLPQYCNTPWVEAAVKPLGRVWAAVEVRRWTGGLKMKIKIKDKKKHIKTKQRQKGKIALMQAWAAYCTVDDVSGFLFPFMVTFIPKAFKGLSCCRSLF